MNRLSSTSLSLLGNTPYLAYNGESVVTRYTNGATTGLQSANGNISYNANIDAISPDAYSYLISRFQGSSGNALTMLQAHLDIALMYNVEPVELYNNYFSDSLYTDLMNMLRTNSAKQGNMSINYNQNSKILRQILA